MEALPETPASSERLRAAARYAGLLAALDLDSFSPRRPARLLDLACGQGRFVDYLGKNGWLDRVAYTGIDGSDGALAEARRRHPGHRFESRRLDAQPFERDAFDVCIIQDLGDRFEELLKRLWPSVTHGLAFVIKPPAPLDDTVEAALSFCREALGAAEVTSRWSRDAGEVIVAASRSPPRRGLVPPAWPAEQPPPSGHGDLQQVRDRLALNASGSSVTGCAVFDYTFGRPNLYRLMRFKQGLVAGLGIDGAFRVYRQTLSIPDCAAVAEVPLRSEHAFAKDSALAFHEISAGGEPFVLQPPPVIGEGNHAPRRSVTRSLYVACLKDAQVRGRSALIESGGVALIDYQSDERDKLDDEIEWDPSILFPKEGDRNSVWVFRPQTRDSSVEVAEAFTLLGVHTDFFGDWMIEYLPRYVAARLSGFLPSVPVLIDANMPEQHRQSLELLFGGEIDLIEVPAFATLYVRKLWCAPCLFYMPLHEKRNERFGFDIVAAPPHRFAPVLEEMSRRVAAAQSEVVASTRVYLARRNFRHRHLVNSAAIEGLAANRGFEVVFPEDLSFSEQVALVRRASHIVAPEGSAIFLVLLASAGTKLCILSHPLTDPLADYHALLSLRQITTVALTGPVVKWHSQTPHDSDYRIDEGPFDSFLAGWLDGG